MKGCLKLGQKITQNRELLRHVNCSSRPEEKLEGCGDLIDSITSRKKTGMGDVTDEIVVDQQKQK